VATNPAQRSLCCVQIGSGTGCRADRPRIVSPTRGDGRFEIDNGRGERRIRMFGERLAAAFTLADSCLLLGIEPHRYLTDVIGKLENSWPLSRLSELVPHRWAAQQAAQQAAK